MSDFKKRDKAKNPYGYPVDDNEVSSGTGASSSGKKTVTLNQPKDAIPDLNLDTPVEERLKRSQQAFNQDKTIPTGSELPEFNLGSGDDSDLAPEGALPPADELIQQKAKSSTHPRFPLEDELDAKKPQVSSSLPDEVSDILKKEISQFREQARLTKPAVTIPQEAPSQAPASSAQRTTSVFNEVNSLVSGTEAVRVAQARITALENERDALRDDMEKLLASSEGYQRRTNELKAQYETLERKHRQKVDILEEEKAVLGGRLKAREDEIRIVKKDHEELQLRFQNDLRRVRVKERELENRLELLKAESSSILRAKDDTIIELKRQLELLSFELDNFRAKSADLHSKINELYERNHRTVKALRLALSVLEIGDSDDPKIKKATG